MFSFQCIRASLICIPFGIAKSPNLNSLLSRLVFHILKEAKPTFVGNHDLIYCNVWPRIEEARLTMSWITRTLYSFPYMDACPPCWLMLSVADMEIPRNHVEPVTRSPVTTVHKAVFLRHLINEHHELWELYPASTITPKMLILHHSPYDKYILERRRSHWQGTLNVHLQSMKRTIRSWPFL